ncbi:MAG: polyprenyl synthetase family protein [Anaerovoracaceae bacterium]
MTNGSNKDKNQTERITYQQAYNHVKEEVDRTLSTSPLVIREYMKHLTLSTGKYIRTVSLLACALDQDDLIHRDAIKLAVAVEIMHLATLVHDDVIDNAEVRRGEPSLQKKYGRRTAVICGDYLLSVALKTASLAEDKEEYVKRSFPDYVGKVCLGELNQHINNGNFDLSLYRYLKIIAGKTAALFEASFHAGAVLSVKEESQIKQYARLGKYIGMIFQLTDDCMDFETTEKVAQKPVKSDFEQNVITLPLIHTFKKMADFKEQAKQGEVTREDIDKAVQKAGGLSFTRLIAKKYYTKSLRILDEMELSTVKREKLLSILEKAYRIF